MFIAGVLAFSVVVPLLSYRIAKSRNQDPGAIAVSLLLFGWGSMLIGLLLSRLQN